MSGILDKGIKSGKTLTKDVYEAFAEKYIEKAKSAGKLLFGDDAEMISQLKSGYETLKKYTVDAFEHHGRHGRKYLLNYARSLMGVDPEMSSEDEDML